MFNLVFGIGKLLIVKDSNLDSGENNNLLK